MAVYKTKLFGNYTQIPNDLIRNRELSYKAKIAQITMLSLSAECEITKKTIRAMCGFGADATTNVVNELEKAGYLHKRDDRKKGKFSCEYDVYNVPTFESVKKDPVSLSAPDEPLAVQPCRENPSRSTIYKKDKAIKKDAVRAEAEKAEPARLPHGKHQNVFLKDDEYGTLVETYGKEQTDYSIDTLSDFKQKKPNIKSMKDFDKLMTSWIKQDISWGKTPKTYVPYQSGSQNKSDDFDVEKYKIFINDFDVEKYDICVNGFETANADIEETNRLAEEREKERKQKDKEINDRRQAERDAHLAEMMAHIQKHFSEKKQSEPEVLETPEETHSQYDDFMSLNDYWDIG